jgi:hypothetical protein
MPPLGPGRPVKNGARDLANKKAKKKTEDYLEKTVALANTFFHVQDM